MEGTVQQVEAVAEQNQLLATQSLAAVEVLAVSTVTTLALTAKAVLQSLERVAAAVALKPEQEQQVVGLVKQAVDG